MKQNQNDEISEGHFSVNTTTFQPLFFSSMYFRICLSFGDGDKLCCSYIKFMENMYLKNYLTIDLCEK